MELTTVTDTTAVFHDGAQVLRFDSLLPNTPFAERGVAFHTLPRPPGECLAIITTVNDLHLGETECGKSEDTGLGPVLRAEPGELPYSEMMSRAAVAEMGRAGPKGHGPDVVVAKGDLTARGAPVEIATFFDCYRTAFGDRLHYILGNHDVGPEGPVGWPPMERTASVVLEGITLALLDTTIAGHVEGGVDPDQMDWLDDLAATSVQPVMVFGHHPQWDPASPTPGLTDDATALLVEVVARRGRICGYFAGHTHRNRVTRMEATGPVPWSEVSATKDYPGVWAEYRVYGTGILALTHRVSSPQALDWTERTRAMFAGLYPMYSFGDIEDRCFAIPFR